MVVRFYFSESYSHSLEKIEDFILESADSLDHVEKFLGKHDHALEFIAENPSTPGLHPQTGDQSWIFGDGRYRIFFKTSKKDSETSVFLTHIIDNRQANLEVYPNNSLPTYEED